MIYELIIINHKNIILKKYLKYIDDSAKAINFFRSGMVLAYNLLNYI